MVLARVLPVHERVVLLEAAAAVRVEVQLELERDVVAEDLALEADVHALDLEPASVARGSVAHGVPRVAESALRVVRVVEPLPRAKHSLSVRQQADQLLAARELELLPDIAGNLALQARRVRQQAPDRQLAVRDVAKMRIESVLEGVRTARYRTLVERLEVGGFATGAYRPVATCATTCSASVRKTPLESSR